MSLQERVIRRIQRLCENPQPVILRLKNGEPYYACYLPVMVKIHEIDSGKLSVRKFNIEVDFSQIGLNVKDNLVGMGGFYYNPKYFGGDNAQKVIAAWDWFLKKMQVDEEDFLVALEGELVWETLLTGFEEGLTYYVLSLVVDLYALDSLGLNVTTKISEVGKQIRNHMRVYEKLSRKKEFSLSVKAVGDAYYRIKNLRLYLANLSSESRLARLAKLYGFDVKLGIHPDLTINGKSVEVKRVRGKYIIPKEREALITIISSESASITSLSNPIREGLRQGADIVAIEVGDLKKKDVKGFKTTWLGKDTLERVLRSAAGYNRKGIILLFSSTLEGIFGRIILAKTKKT